MAKTKFYAVAVGRTSGTVVSTWDECKALVHGYSGAKFKSFPTRDDAMRYLNNEATTASSSSSSNNAVAAPLDVKVEPSVKRKTPEVIVSSLVSEAIVVPTTTGPSLPTQGKIENPYKKRVKLEDNLDTTTAISSAVSSVFSNDIRSTKSMTTILQPQRPPSSCRIRLHIMFDGGARGNPGVAGAGASVSLLSTTTTIIGVTAATTTTTVQQTRHIRFYVGQSATNNVAEYSGLVKGLEMAQAMVSTYLQQQQQQSDPSNTTSHTTAAGEVIVQGDSNLIIQQLHGVYKVKNDKLKPLYAQTQQRLQELRRIGLSHQVFQHVYRDGNHVADGPWWLYCCVHCFFLFCFTQHSILLCFSVSIRSTGQSSHGHSSIVVYVQCRRSQGAVCPVISKLGQGLGRD
jgi:ribonuclease HI